MVKNLRCKSRRFSALEDGKDRMIPGFGKTLVFKSREEVIVDRTFQEDYHAKTKMLRPSILRLLVKKS